MKYYFYDPKNPQIEDHKQYDTESDTLELNWLAATEALLIEDPVKNAEQLKEIKRRKAEIQYRQANKVMKPEVYYTTLEEAEIKESKKYDN